MENLKQETPKENETNKKFISYKNDSLENSNGNETKKSYKGALTKEVTSNLTAMDDRTQVKIKDKSTEQKENKSPESWRSQNNTVIPNGSSHSRTWKKNPNMKKDEEESLTDLSSWPTLDKVKIEPSKDKKTKEEEESPNQTTENTTKKKGVNWVPLQIETNKPRQNGSRGRGAKPKKDFQSGQTPIGVTNRNNAQWRGNYRGNRRGRGNNQQFIPQTVYFPYPMEELPLKQTIQKQIEYYFSVENLCKDLYFRKQMDEEGWVPISLIANFNRVKNLTTDISFLVECLEHSTLVEIHDEKIRKKEDWKAWVLPNYNTSL